MNSEDFSAVPRLYYVGATPHSIRSACDTLPYPSQQFSNGHELFSFLSHDQVGCVIVEHRSSALSVNPYGPNESETSGVQFATELHLRNRALQVLIVIQDLASEAFRELYHSSIFDILTANMPSETILDAVDAAAKKSLLVSYSLMEDAVLRDRLGSLTQRESDVVKLLCLGKQLKEVSAELSVSVQTASKHRSRIFRKLRVANEVELFKYYGELLLTPPNEEQEVARPPNFLGKNRLRVDDHL